MMINHDKTKNVHSDIQKRNFASVVSHACRETPIQYTDCYEYLGVEFSEYHR